MTLSREFVLLQVAFAGLISMNARADELDTLQFKAGESIQRDSNVYRLSDSAGLPIRSDTIAVTTLGVKVDKTYSLQRFELDLNVDHFNYKNLSNLDFTAINYAAAWRWSLTPALHGNLTTDRREYVDNTADLQNQRNVRTDRSTLLDAEYEIDGAWRAVGGVFERETKNSLNNTFEGNSKVKGAEGGVRYVFPSNTSLAYRFRQGKGEYPGGTVLPSFFNDFTDREHEFRLDWPITGKTTIESRISYLDRAHDGFAAGARDFSGFIGQVKATWEATGKTRVVAGMGHELNSYQTNDTSYYQGYQFFIAPTWKPTAKTSVQFRYEHGVRDFKGPLPGYAPTNRSDTLNLSSLAFEWQPTRVITVTASALHDSRKSNEAISNYKSNGISLSVLARF